MPERIPQGATIRVPLQAYLASDHVSPATGKTIAVTVSKNGASYASPSGGATNATEVGSGSYYVDLSTTDTGTAGPLFVKGAEGMIDNVIAIYNVVNAHNAGLDALPATACTTNASLLTSGTGTDQLGVSSGLPTSNLNLTQTVTDVQTATVGGALSGAWATAWGKIVKNVVAKTLGAWGPGNSSGTASKTFTLDDGTSPTSRTP